MSPRTCPPVERATGDVLLERKRCHGGVGRINQARGSFKGIPTTSNDYHLELDRPLGEPQRTLVVGCAPGMDVSVTQTTWDWIP